MKNYLERLLNEHRRLNRLIDTCRNASRQDEMKALKRLRLSLKDRIARLQSGANPLAR
ncbi:YdcH family protein [Novosphingobium sp.]|uniref:YdcH family protein n=1 Tax=Novosphingobium sp. TaxID=1874826 RepID=UPI0025F4D0C4|nr:YdcH family protein [Novosphingobium sp.]